MTRRGQPDHARHTMRLKPGAGASASTVPVRPARDRVTTPVPPADATEPMREHGRIEPVRGDEATERMPAEPSPFPAPAPAQRAQPASDRSVQAIGQYELIRLLGRGGMGEVHLARDLRLGRLVAVKRLHAPGPGLAERFLAEARATARCHHENIVVIHEVGEDVERGGHPYMVLEYLRGQTLRQWLGEQVTASGERAAVPTGRAVDLMLPVVRALAYAHERGIVHRDLKPENVMITQSGTIKVLDFGIAKLLRAPGPDAEPEGGVPDAVADPASGRALATAPVPSSSLIGTLAYMSPEQMNVGVIDHRSDLWAVGIMLFEMVTGRHPVSGRSMADLMRVADEDEPMPGVVEVRPDLASDIGLLASVIDRCLLKSPAHRTPSARVLLAELEALAPGRDSVPVSEDGNPFAGLAAFQEVDADRFFGRDRDIDHIVTELRSRPLAAIIGPSGAGKSSLVRAGVIPALKRSGEGWDAHVVRPGREPLGALAGILVQAGSSSAEIALPGGGAPGVALRDSAATAVLGPLIERLRAEPGYLGARLRARAASKRRRVLVFVDQLEELYTLGALPEERAVFLACLAAVADDAASPLRVIVSMRSDFLDRLAEDRHLGPEVTRGLVLLPHMSRDGMRQALQRPVEASGHRFESQALVDRMVEALAATPGALPLLQFTAARLWELRDTGRRLLTEASYEQLGGVAGALATHADAVLAGMPARDARLARAVFLRLVTPERTRQLATLSELRQMGRTSGGMDRVLARLIDARLLAVESSAPGAGTHAPDGTDGVVEIVHESLIDTWPALGRWLVECEDDAVMLARLRAAAADWERGGKAAGLLWTGASAHEARAWRERYQGELAPAEERYLSAVADAVERSRRVRRRLVGSAFATAMAFAAAMSWLAWRQSEAREAATGAAEKAEREAMRARDAVRMSAVRALPEDPTTQLALLREIEHTSAPPRGAAEEAKRLLYGGVASAILTGYVDYFFPGRSMLALFSPDGTRIAFAASDNTVRVWRTDGSGELAILRGHDGQVSSVSFSPDGTRIVSASADETVRVWRADGSGEPVVLRGHEGRVSSASFSPDGIRIVSTSGDKTVRVWRADGSGEPVVLRGHEFFGVSSASFSPDGTRIVSASADETVRVWRADGFGEPVVLRGHTEGVSSASFSPDGTRIVSTSGDKTVRVWRADGSGEPVVLRGHDGWYLSASFSPDGTRIVSASEDKTMRVWRADGTGEPVVLRGHEEGVLSASFSPDGTHIVSASWDKTVRVRRADGTGEPVVLRGHRSVVAGASFSPDGTRIVSASMDETVRVWRADGTGMPMVLRGHDAAVWSASFSPDGTRIVSTSEDKTVRVWRANGTGEPVVLSGHDDRVTSASFSPDGTRIVSTSEDKTVRVWRADGPGKPVVLRGHDSHVNSAEFSADGTHILSEAADETVRVWHADGTGEPVVLRGWHGWLSEASFSPDGNRIVSASADGTVTVSRADGTGEPVDLRGHDDRVTSVSFSPDGNRIVSTSDDKTVRVWRADGTGEPMVLRGHDEQVLSASFSPDGTRILSTSMDKTARVWRADGTGEAVVLRGHDGEDLSPSFSPDGRYIVSGGKAIRIWNADGAGEPVILTGHTGGVNDAEFSPDGRSIVSASEDGTVRVWRDLAPVALDDPRLWTATTYCMPVERRMELLGVTEETASRDLQRCRERVAEAHRTATTQPQR